MKDAVFSHYMGVKYHDIADGPGVRVAVYLSGCPFHCDGCHNEEAWDYEAGDLLDNPAMGLISANLNTQYNAGLSILGGEPLAPRNREATASLVNMARRCYMGAPKTVWVYTGYTFEELQPLVNRDEDLSYILGNADVLVDGRFVKELADPSLRFKGSSNQRIIDLKETMEEGEVVLWSE